MNVSSPLPVRYLERTASPGCIGCNNGELHKTRPALRPAAMSDGSPSNYDSFAGPCTFVMPLASDWVYSLFAGRRHHGVVFFIQPFFAMTAKSPAARESRSCGYALPKTTSNSAKQCLHLRIPSSSTKPCHLSWPDYGYVCPTKLPSSCFPQVLP
jgi:hypothetical protein